MTTHKFSWPLAVAGTGASRGGKLYNRQLPLARFENWHTAEKWQHDCPTKQLFDLTTTITDSWGCAWQQG